MSEDEYSELTDIETDDEGGVSEYRIRNPLSPPRPTTYTAQSLFDQIHSNDIDLEPEYQRDVVWSEAKQIGIIDSIYRNFYVPPVIFTVKTDDEGAETRTCIDGKQRLTSIHKFMDGLIPHKDQVTGQRYWYKDAGTGTGGRKKLLPDRLRKIFANKQIVCMEYQDLGEAAEREIFQRVQLGMALTPAEKLQVVKNPRSDFIRELQNKYMKEEGSLCNGTIRWDTSRGGDYRGLAQSVYCMDKIDTGLRGVGMPQLEKWLATNQPLDRKFTNQVRDTFRVLADLAEDKKFNKIFQEPVKTSPIEFIMYGVLVYVHKDKASMAQLASGIAKMRLDVRNIHVDIRANTRITKTLADFISKWKPSKLPGDTGAPAGRPSTGAKRKRTNAERDAGEDEDSNDEDEDETYDPPNKKVAKKSTNAVASSSTAPSNSTIPTIKIKAEPKTTLPSVPHAPHPPTDRMAALRRAKEVALQNKALHKIPGLHSAADQSSVPQMLPSPGQPFSFPSSISNPPPPSASSSSSSSMWPPVTNANVGASNRPPPTPTGASLDSTLMATMTQGRAGPSLRPNNLPPPPASSEKTDRPRDNDDRSRYDRHDSGQFDSRRGR